MNETAKSVSTPIRVASVMLLCGLPGCGKSTVARNVLNHFKSLGHRSGVETDEISYDEIYLIDYDHITDLLVLQDQILPDSSESDTDEILASLIINTQNYMDIRNINHPYTLDENYYDEMHLEAWKQTRTKALQVLDYILRKWANIGPDSLQNILILLDDNFHLKSMRQNVLRVCQNILATSHHDNHYMSFSVLWVDTNIEECIRRNAHRQGRARVPDRVLDNMRQCAEFPCTARLANPHCDTHFGVVQSFDLECEGKYDIALQVVRELLFRAMQVPIKAPNLEEVARLEEQIKIDRERTLKNLRHTVDVHLRHVVGRAAKLDKLLAPYANKVRKAMLQELRHDFHQGASFGADVQSGSLLRQQITKEFCSQLVSMLANNNSGHEVLEKHGGSHDLYKKLDEEFENLNTIENNFLHLQEVRQSIKHNFECILNM